MTLLRDEFLPVRLRALTDDPMEPDHHHRVTLNLPFGSVSTYHLHQLGAFQGGTNVDQGSRRNL